MKLMYNDMSIFPNINLSNEQKAKLSSLQQEMHNGYLYIKVPKATSDLKVA